MRKTYDDQCAHQLGMVAECALRWLACSRASISRARGERWRPAACSTGCSLPDARPGWPELFGRHYQALARCCRAVQRAVGKAFLRAYGKQVDQLQPGGHDGRSRPAGNERVGGMLELDTCLVSEIGGRQRNGTPAATGLSRRCRLLGPVRWRQRTRQQRHRLPAGGRHGA